MSEHLGSHSWFCRWGDGASHGRIILADPDNEKGDREDEKIMATGVCPVCSYPKDYHGCGWVIVVEPFNA